MLDVRRMRVLREVVSSGSFSAAAEALHLSQSAVSQQIAALEREVGMPLLERTSGGLKRGDFDLVVVFDYPNFPLEFDRDTDAEIVYEEPMWVALPPGHPLAAAKSVRIEDLADEDWLCGALPSSCRYQVLQLGRDAGFEPRIAFHSEDYNVIKGFVAAGLGVTVLPELAADHPEIELRDVRGAKPTRRIWAVTRESEARPPAAEEMLGI